MTGVSQTGVSEEHRKRCKVLVCYEVGQMIFARLSAGETVTIGDDMLDAIPALLNESQWQHWTNHLRTMPNKERVGTRDTYVATMDEYRREF